MGKGDKTLEPQAWLHMPVSSTAIHIANILKITCSSLCLAMVQSRAESTVTSSQPRNEPTSSPMCGTETNESFHMP